MQTILFGVVPTGTVESGNPAEPVNCSIDNTPGNESSPKNVSFIEILGWAAKEITSSLPIQMKNKQEKFDLAPDTIINGSSCLEMAELLLGTQFQAALSGIQHPGFITANADSEMKAGLIQQLTSIFQFVTTDADSRTKVNPKLQNLSGLLAGIKELVPGINNLKSPVQALLNNKTGLAAEGLPETNPPTGEPLLTGESSTPAESLLKTAQPDEGVSPITGELLKTGQPGREVSLTEDIPPMAEKPVNPNRPEEEAVQSAGRLQETGQPGREVFRSEGGAPPAEESEKVDKSGREVFQTAGELRQTDRPNREDSRVSSTLPKTDGPSIEVLQTMQSPPKTYRSAQDQPSVQDQGPVEEPSGRNINAEAWFRAGDNGSRDAGKDGTFTQGQEESPEPQTKLPHQNIMHSAGNQDKESPQLFQLRYEAQLQFQTNPVQEYGKNPGQLPQLFKMGQVILGQIAQKIKLVISPGVTEMKIQLKPEFLGKLHLSVSSESGLITAEFKAESYHVKGLIEANLSTLKDALAEQGIKVDQLVVNVGTEKDYSGFREREAIWENNGFNKGKRDVLGDEQLNQMFPLEDGPEAVHAYYRSTVDLMA